MNRNGLLKFYIPVVSGFVKEQNICFKQWSNLMR